MEKKQPTRAEVLVKVEAIKNNMKRINGEINANLTDTEYAEDMQPLLVGYAAMLKKAEQWLKENPQ